MSKLSVLTVFNAYLNRGGEDEVFEAEADLLEQHGHQVTRLLVPADEMKATSAAGKAKLAAGTIWSTRYQREIGQITRKLRPDVVHFHNTFPLLSPSVYGACRSEGAAVVQTLHNYRLICPSTVLFRDGHVCTECVGKSVAWPSIRHACYHESAPQTAVIAAMLAVHKARGTWHRDVDLFLTPTQYARERFIEGGLPADKLAVKPNFVDHAAPAERGPAEGFVFAGRLVEHKGIPALLDAWRLLPAGVPLRIIGDGPMRADVEAFAAAHSNVTYMGRRPHERVLTEMQTARALIFPSTWTETFGLTVVEAFATGLPVIGSDIRPTGSELIEDGVTGRLFPPGDGEALASVVLWAHEHRDDMRRMGNTARGVYEAKYTPAENYRQLIGAYERARRVAVPRVLPFPDLTSDIA